MKENQRVVISKRMIREGLLRLLAYKQLEEINITELCKEAGINRSTFYSYYSQPRDVLLEIGDTLIQETQRLSPNPKNLHEAKEAIERTLTYVSDRSDLMKILIQNQSDDFFSHVLNRFYKIFADMKGDIRSVSDLDEDSTKLLTTYCIGGAFFLLRQWLIEGIDKTPKEIADLLYRFIDKGFAF